MASSILNSDDGVISGTSGLKSSGGDDGVLVFQSKGTETARITATGNVGIGTSSPNAQLEVSRSATNGFSTMRWSNTGASGRTYEIGLGGNTASAGFANNLYFYDSTAAATRMVIDSSGNVGIGTSSPSTELHVVAASSYAELRLQGASGSSGSVEFYNGTTKTGDIFIDDSNNIRFRNTSSSIERARITSSGYFKASSTGSYNNATGPYHELRHGDTGQVCFIFSHTDASNPFGGQINFTGASPDNNTNYFLACTDTAANRMLIYSDGDVWTSDAGTLSSDQKLKNTITDASPKLDDVMKLRVRNFYWNEDYHPEKTDKKLIGFIAQEFEEVFPGLVTEGVIRGGNPIYEDHAIVDEEGNPVLDKEGNTKTEQVQVGETEKEYAKGIKEGKLIPILVKALQEAVERIETLEAKVSALEGN
jgi:hypothetical protein